jgi:tetratricopeptide (TPR) repeat protein
MDAGLHGSEANAPPLLEQAVQAFRRALEVYTKANPTERWVDAQLDLGDALMRIAAWANGSQSAMLFDQAAQAYRQALEAVSKQNAPRDWADAHSRLGEVLLDRYERSGADRDPALLDLSIEASQDALQVYNKPDNPQEWANTQMILGSSLLTAGEIAGDAEKLAELLNRSEQAFRRALEVYTQSSDPQNWANTELSFAENELAAQNFPACLQRAASLQDGSLDHRTVGTGPNHPKSTVS